MRPMAAPIGIGDLVEPQTRSCDVQPGCENAAEEPAEEGKTAFPDRKNSPGLTQVIGRIVLHDVIQASAEQASDQNPDDEVFDPSGCDLPACSPAPRERAAHQERSRPAEPVPINRERSEMRDRVPVDVDHCFLSSSVLLCSPTAILAV